jgi:hypothetical protein
MRISIDEGQADALKKALSRATGNIVGWLTVDEFYEPGIFPAVVEAFQKASETVLVNRDFRRVTADGTTIRRSGLRIRLA